MALLRLLGRSWFRRRFGELFAEALVLHAELANGQLKVADDDECERVVVHTSPLDDSRDDAADDRDGLAICGGEGRRSGAARHTLYGDRGEVRVPPSLRGCAE